MLIVTELPSKIWDFIILYILILIVSLNYTL